MDRAAEPAENTVARDGSPVAELRSLESLKLKNWGLGGELATVASSAKKRTPSHRHGYIQRDVLMNT